MHRPRGRGRTGSGGPASAGFFFFRPGCTEEGAGGVLSAGTALGDLSQDVPVRSPVPGADGIDEHLVGVVVVILLRLCGVEEKKSPVAPREILEPVEEERGDSG